MLSLLTRILILLDQGPTLMTLFKLNCFHKDPVSKYVHVGIRATTYEFGGGHKQFLTDALETFGHRRCGENTEPDIQDDLAGGAASQSPG